MATRLNTTTGDDTARFGFRGTDLGYFTLTNHGYVLSTFGDTFDTPMPSDKGWRSPVILRTSNADLDAGLKWDNAVGGNRAKEVLPYRHDPARAYDNKDTPFTIIPNDVVHLPDGRYLMSSFLVRSWDRHGRHSWLTWCNRFYTSTQRDAEHWENTAWRDLNGGPVQFNNDGGEWSKFQNASLVLVGDYLYMFGTESGRTDDGGIYLARVPWREWDRLFSWQFWGWTGSTWQWGTDHATAILTPTVPGTAIGELNAQVIDGEIVLNYIDYGVGAVTRTAMAPDSVWTTPQLHATAWQVPNLYAPSIHPYSTLAKPYMHLSQWTHINEDFYGCRFYRLDALRSSAPVTPAEGTVENTDKAVCEDTTDLGAGQIADMLTSGTSIDPVKLAAELVKRLRR